MAKRSPATLASSTGKPRAQRARAGATRNRHWVFVYGTLKRGFANHAMLAGATFIGEFRTLNPYPLVVGTHPLRPALARSPSLTRAHPSRRLLLSVSARHRRARLPR